MPLDELVIDDRRPPATPRIRLLLIALVVGGGLILPVLITAIFGSVGKANVPLTPDESSQVAAGLGFARAIVVLTVLGVAFIQFRYRPLRLMGGIIVGLLLAASLFIWFAVSVAA